MAQPVWFAAAWAALAIAWPLAPCAEHLVDVNIVTALDASDSIMRHEEWIEIDGMLRAVKHPDFLEAVQAGPCRQIGFAAFTWSSHGDLRVVVPWTVLGSAADAEHVAQALAKLPRHGSETYGGDQDPPEGTPALDRMTDVSGALRYGLDLLAAAPHRARRSVLNIVGNGVDNVGEGPERARDLALAAGVTVNGLVIGGEAGPFGLLPGAGSRWPWLVRGRGARAGQRHRRDVAEVPARPAVVGGGGDGVAVEGTPTFGCDDPARCPHDVPCGSRRASGGRCRARGCSTREPRG